jgi:hypothetical protein
VGQSETEQAKKETAEKSTIDTEQTHNGQDVFLSPCWEISFIQY